MSAQVFPHPLGDYFETDDVLAFFGNSRSTREALEREFPHYRFVALKQTHSDIIVKSPYEGDPPEADAHFTRQAGVALCIRTADCIPVLLFEPRSGTIAAIHAGWRGVENGIILKTCARLNDESLDLSLATVWIGPHIGRDSFEVGKDIAQRLDRSFQDIAAHSDASTALLNHEDPEKTRIDLLTIARAQLLSKKVQRANIHELKIDTFTAPYHHSHRRDRERAGRQISFIVVK